MPLEHSNATAILTVTGLSLGCYNPATLNWEVGFIRAERHRLTIKVTKQTPEGPVNLTFQPDEQNRIFVDAQNAVSPANPLYMPMPAFNRAAPPENVDLEDLRWVVDVETELNDQQPIILIKPEHPVTPMFVSKPVLYADHENVIEEQTLLIRAGDSKDVVRPFGRLSEGTKADITCQEGGAVVLRVEGPLGFSLVLPHVPGDAPHEIVIDNTCPPTRDETESSDFTLYYSVVKDTAGDRFDIFVPELGSGQGAVCNNTFMGISTSMFPLPK